MRPKRSDSLTTRSSRCFTPNYCSFRTVWKAFARMDGALLGLLDIAMGKARTAALFGFNTEALYDFCKPGGASPGFENSNGGLVVFAGGIPVRDAEGRLLGAVGVSGGAVAQDLGVAEAAVLAAQAA